MKVGDKVDADHQPLEVWVEDRIGRKKGRTTGRMGWKRRWDEVDRREFSREIEGIETKQGELGEEWEKMEKRVKEALKERKRSGEKGREIKKRWWDEECVKKKERLGKS